MCITIYVDTICLSDNSFITNICYICYTTLAANHGMSGRLNISQNRRPLLNGCIGDTNKHKTHLLFVVVRHLWPLEYHSVCEIWKSFVHANFFENLFGFMLISGVLFSKLNRKRKPQHNRLTGIERASTSGNIEAAIFAINFSLLNHLSSMATDASGLNGEHLKPQIRYMILTHGQGAIYCTTCHFQMLRLKSCSVHVHIEIQFHTKRWFNTAVA